MKFSYNGDVYLRVFVLSFMKLFLNVCINSLCYWESLEYDIVEILFLLMLVGYELNYNEFFKGFDIELCLRGGLNNLILNFKLYYLMLCVFSGF